MCLSDIVTALIRLTENKTFAAVVGVVIGSGIIAVLLKARDRRIARRDESLKFITETADLLNAALTRLFATIRREDATQSGVLDQRIAALFERRMSTRAKSLVLLESTDFWAEYENIMRRLDAIQRASKPLFGLQLSTTPQPVLDGKVFSWVVAETEAEQLWQRANHFINCALDSVITGYPLSANDLTSRGRRSSALTGPAGSGQI
jgi:hypothetical protein